MENVVYSLSDPNSPFIDVSFMSIDGTRLDQRTERMIAREISKIEPNFIPTFDQYLSMRIWSCDRNQNPIAGCTIQNVKAILKSLGISKEVDSKLFWPLLYVEDSSDDGRKLKYVFSKNHNLFALVLKNGYVTDSPEDYEDMIDDFAAHGIYELSEGEFEYSQDKKTVEKYLKSLGFKKATSYPILVHG